MLLLTTADPTATPPAVAAIWPNRDGCWGWAIEVAGAGAVGGARAGTLLGGGAALKIKDLSISVKHIKITKNQVKKITFAGAPVAGLQIVLDEAFLIKDPQNWNIFTNNTKRVICALWYDADFDILVFKWQNHLCQTTNVKLTKLNGNNLFF